MSLPGISRKQALLASFQSAGTRGLTRREMQDIAGACWRRRLHELETDGYVFHTRTGRYGGARPWRWVLVVEPTAPRHRPGLDAAAELVALFDPPAPPPADALTEDAA